MRGCKYYPAQMNGNVISAFGQAQNARFSEAQAIQEYLYRLSINTANETELENIGRIIGYVRPLVPEGFNAENIFLLGGLPLETDPSIGLAEAGTVLGGRLSTVTKTQTGFMELGLYRKLLKSIAVLKRYGITLKSVDMIASVISKDYTIEFDANADIVIHTNAIESLTSSYRKLKPPAQCVPKRPGTAESFVSCNF